VYAKSITALHTLPPWLGREDKIGYLEELRRFINDILREIDRKLEELKSK